MWCDNCLLIFPLRHGAMALAGFIACYSLAGAIVIFNYGEYFWFGYYEYQVYGGISIAVMVVSLLSAIGISNNSLMWLRLCFFLWPCVLLVDAIRAGVMMFRLDYYQANVVWECDHGGMLYNSTLAANSTFSADASSSGSTMPSTFCSGGFHNLYIAFVFSIALDGCLQLYMYFLEWRCCQRVYHNLYFLEKGPYGAGYYA